MNIIIDGKTYEKKRYTYNELKEMFPGKVVFIEDPTMKGLYPTDGILINVCDSKQKDDYSYKYYIENRNVEKLDFTVPPMFITFQGVT